MKPKQKSGIETVWVQLPTMSAHEAFSLGKEIAANSRHPLANRIARALGERYFPEGQKAAVAVSLLPIFERRAKSRMADGARGAAGKSSDEVGKLFHISGRYVRAAKRLQSENPKLFQSVLRGRINLSQACAQLRAASSARRAAVSPAESVRKSIERIALLHGRRAFIRGLTDYFAIKAGVDLVVTDRQPSRASRVRKASR
jgi:hypothetical protein